MKQKQLERAREIEKEFLLNKDTEDWRRYFRKELHKIKDNWKDIEGCGKEFINPNINVHDKCGDILDNDLLLCKECQKQNKEFKQICERVLK